MPKTETKPASTAATAQGSLDIRDSRSGKDYNLPIATEGPEGDTYVKAMDLRQVALEYGGKVAFWGGLSDQAVAVNTPAQVRDEVRRAIDILGAPYGNAYILALSNIMMPEIPIANIVALFEACHDQ